MNTATTVRNFLLLIAAFFLAACTDESPTENKQRKEMEAFTALINQPHAMGELGTHQVSDSSVALESSSTSVWFLIGVHRWSSAKQAEGLDSKALHFTWQLGNKWVISDVPLSHVRYVVTTDKAHTVKFKLKYENIQEWQFDVDPQEFMENQVYHIEVSCTQEELQRFVELSK